MAEDDRRMHGGNKPGLEPGRGQERHEIPVQLNHPEPGDTDPLNAPRNAGDDASDTTDREQDSALGGHVATRSSSGAEVGGRDR